MRDAFSKTLVKLAQAEKNLLLLTGDHGYARFVPIRTIKQIKLDIPHDNKRINNKNEQLVLLY